jgi:hypothetical protein
LHDTPALAAAHLAARAVLGEMGGAYPEAVELVHQAGTYNALSCSVAFDALPQAPSVQALAKKGAEDPDFFGTDKEIMSARENLGATPTLFDKSDAQKTVAKGELRVSK